MDILLIRTARLLGHQRVIRPAIDQRRIQLLAVDVAGKRPRLPHQPVDEVPVVDPALVPAPQARQALHQLLGIPDLDLLQADPHFDLRTDQSRRHRIGIVLHPNGAASTHPHALPFQRLQTPRRQGPEVRHLLGHLRRPPRIALAEHPQDELPVLRAAGKNAAAAEQQPLLHRLFEMPM
jgi:hypothetical protein